MQSREELRIAESIQLEATGPVLWRQDGQHRELLMFTGDSIHCCRYPSVMPSRFAKIDNFAHNITCVDMPCMSSPNEETPQRRLLLGCRDGVLCVTHPKTLNIEVSVQAHEGEVTAVKWNNHGTSIASSGVDGSVKLWSAKGTLRATVVTLPLPILALGWSNDGAHVAFTSDVCIYINDIRQQKRNTHYLKLKVPILALAWSPVDKIVVCGGEDRRFRLLSEKGLQLCGGDALDASVRSFVWLCEGRSFVAGTERSLYLCAASGNILSKLALTDEGVNDIVLAPDKNTFAVATVEHLWIVRVVPVVDVSTLSDQYYSHLTEMVRRYFPEDDRLSDVSHCSEDYGYLAATIGAACFLLANEESGELHPVETHATIRAVKLACDRLLLLLVSGDIVIYDYNGTMQCTLERPGKATRGVDERQIDLTRTVVAVCAGPHAKVIDFYSSTTGHALRQSDEHDDKIVALSLCKTKDVDPAACVFLDTRGDVYLISSPETNDKVKIGGMATDIRWHSEHDILAAIIRRELVVWHLASAFGKRRGADGTLRIVVAHSLEEDARIAGFRSSICSIASWQEGITHTQLDPLLLRLHELLQAGEWKRAVKYCRRLNVGSALWMCLSARAAMEEKRDIVTTAMCALGHIEYIPLEKLA